MGNAYETERKRAEALAEIDRDKTVFFSNVSHEFRTSLTLMLASVEDALADTAAPLPPIQRDRLEIVHRNSLRLLKLVNTLLDFSCLEARRIQAVYEPTDLATFTAELASTFRSLLERAGIALVVECSPFTEAIYVDREMWEKIIFSLLSNAFKLTFTGTISIRCQQVGDHVELAIADTGIGIPPEEIPHLFESFHDVKGAQGRSFEGSGIGLSLVQELVKLHSGNISVTSTLGQGSCFNVSIPLGSAHLPQDRIGATCTLAPTTMDATPYIEALPWLPDESLAAEKARKEADANAYRLNQILESMNDGFLALDQDWRIIYQNAAAEKINHSQPRSQVLGKTHWEVWPATAGSELERQYRYAIAAQVPVHFEYHYYEPPEFDIWTEIHAYPFEGGLGTFFRDITERKQIERNIREREEILQLFFQSVPSGVAMFDCQMRYLMASQRWLDDYNLGSVESVIGRSHYDIFPELPQQWKQIHQRCLAGAIERCEADCFERQDGSIQWIRWEVRPWYHPNQEIGGIIIFSEDITERRQAEFSLQQSQLQLQQQLAEIETIYQSAPIGLNVLDTNLRFVRINQRLAEINGLSVEAHLGRTIREVVPDLADAAEKLLRLILETGEPLLNVELTGETPAQPGVQRTWLEHFFPLKNGDQIIGINTVCEEITERKRLEAERRQAEIELQRSKEELEVRVAERTADLSHIIAELQQAQETIKASLLEKEVLLKEVHHRVKNNLGIVSSLLQMQARRTKDPEASKILQDSRNRISSIALVHEKLYRSEDLANIDFAQYLKDLVIYLLDSYNISSSQVKLDLQIEPVTLDIETAIPCGLIVNELVSNALKHGFINVSLTEKLREHPGEIQVKLEVMPSVGENHQRSFTLTIRDNGVGLPNDFDPKKTKTLGLSLVQGLVQQIRGKIEINCHQGTEVKVSFQVSS